MYYYEIIPAELFRLDGGALTYACAEILEPGLVVKIPLGKKTVLGVVVRQVRKVDFKTKPIVGIIYPLPLPPHLVQAANWLANYYLTPLPIAINLLLPPGMASRNLTKTCIETGSHEIKLPLIKLNTAQKRALQEISDISSTTRLLRGITGSGKTNIYLKLAADTLQKQKSVILLVPEIALTSQLVNVFSQTFGDNVTVIHSNQTMKERRDTWVNIIERTNKNEPLVIIGPRSALLTPVANLGLIIIDEAHENSYHQENAPRYSALRLASAMAANLKIPCLLGSATPNVVDLHLARAHGALVELNHKAKDAAIEPEIEIIDLKDRAKFSKNRYFANVLLEKIRDNLRKKQQTLIFHNRRGSAPLTICEHCGWQALCPECFLPMTLHSDSYELCCHICGHIEKVPSECPECHKVGVIHKGFGTKLLETELKKVFPEAKIVRFDGDNKKGASLADLYDSVSDGDVDILVGTQTLARGLDLPHLATVGIVQADAGLALPDFAAEERTFELLAQVIGRVGRGHLSEASVFIQTYQPEHTVIKTAAKADFNGFAEYLLKERRRANLPPYSYIARLSATYKTEKTAAAKIQQAHRALLKNPRLIVAPPMPAFHERTERGYTWQLIIKAKSRQALTQELLPYAKTAGYNLVLDPPSLL